MLFKNTLTAAALLGSLLVASSAFAHAHLKSSTPAADSRVSAPPSELSLVFTEGVEADFSTVTLTKDGDAVLVKTLSTNGSDKNTLIVSPAAPLTAGDYTVKWQVTSVDTHKLEGTYSFTVGE